MRKQLISFALLMTFCKISISRRVNPTQPPCVRPWAWKSFYGSRKVFVAFVTDSQIKTHIHLLFAQINKRWIKTQLGLERSGW